MAVTLICFWRPQAGWEVSVLPVVPDAVAACPLPGAVRRAWAALEVYREIRAYNAHLFVTLLPSLPVEGIKIFSLGPGSLISGPALSSTMLMSPYRSCGDFMLNPRGSGT